MIFLMIVAVGALLAWLGVLSAHADSGRPRAKRRKFETLPAQGHGFQRAKPEWVRKDKIAAKDPAKGVEGDPRNGRAELGKVQQDLKVKVAVAQIRAQVASHHGK